MTKILHNVSLTLIFVVLLSPMLLFLFPLIKVKNLQGAITLITATDAAQGGWYDESFQKNKEKYLNQEFGFRNTLVRLNNELYYRIFCIAKAKGVIMGKEGYLFEETYINDYYGINFIGQKKIDENVARLTKIDSVFKTLNKTLLIVFAPGKASFYPEYIPDNYKRVGKETNYKGYRKSVQQSGINFIDFNEYLLANKGKTSYEQYPKTGIHWSDYAAIIALDSINKKLASIRNYKPVQIYWTEIVDNKDSVSTVDSDIENGMNLIFNINKPRMSYPVLKYEERNKQKPTVLNIGDSFYANVFDKDIPQKLFTNAGFAFFSQIKSPFLQGTQDVGNINLKEFIDKHDVIILMCTEGTIVNFPFEYDKKLARIYCASELDNEAYAQKIESVKAQIKATPEWLKKVTKKAVAKNISVEAMIAEDAEYSVNNP
ncbi:MAG: hypothetical protein H7331_08795 [Bacteroidia bacterium]|nr:hypothetical protein [Bacteroidia bacterium]